MIDLPVLIVQVRVPDPAWIRQTDEMGNCVNIHKQEIEVDVWAEVLQLNLIAGTMKVRYRFPSNQSKTGYAIRTNDMSIKAFEEIYKIVRKI